MHVERGSEVRLSFSKRLYSQHSTSCDQTVETATSVSPKARNTKVPRGTTFTFNVQTFLSDLERRSEQIVLNARRQLQMQLDTIFSDATWQIKKKLLCQFEYCFVYKFKDSFSQYKDWVLTSGEFEVPAGFGSARRIEPIPRPVDDGYVELSKIQNKNDPIQSSSLKEKVAQLRDEACALAESLKELQASRAQVAASIQTKKLEYLRLYAALSQHRVYSTALQSTAAFAEPHEGEPILQGTPRDSSRSDVTALEPKDRLLQVVEISDVVGRLREAIKMRQLLGTQLEGLSPLFPLLEADDSTSSDAGRGSQEYEHRCTVGSRTLDMNSGCRLPLSRRSSMKVDLQSPETTTRRDILMPLTQAESRALALEMFTDLVERDKRGFGA